MSNSPTITLSAPDMPPDPALDGAARAALETWRDGYLARLTASDGWWAISALAWLEDGPARLGGGPDAEVALPFPAAPVAATLQPSGASVRVTPAAPGLLWLEGAPLSTPVEVRERDQAFALGPDRAAPSFAVLVRGERRGVRVYDPRRVSERDPRREVAWYPVTPGWCVPARFEPAVEGELVPVVNVIGDVSDAPAAGWLHFAHAGAEHSLLATWAGERLFLNLRDAGSGPESYEAGRYLHADAPQNGWTVLDFHRLHHPPCAHTPFATCPLPPLVNRLPFVVEAGERHPPS